MPVATRLRDKPHARLYHEWLALPAWLVLSPYAKALLIEMHGLYRLASPTIKMTDRNAARIIPCSRSTAAKALVELEKTGWISLESVGRRCKATEKRVGSAYRLNTQAFHQEPPSEAFMHWRKT
jgi:hypothetical protein